MSVDKELKQIVKASEQPKKEDVTYEFNPEGLQVKTVHPAIDVMNDALYVGMHLPAKLSDGEEKEALFLLRTQCSGIEVVGASKTELKARGWRLSTHQMFIPARWSLNSIKTFIAGSQTPNKQEVLNAVLNAFTRYIEYPDPRFYVFVTLWSIGTYFHVLFNSFPYLYVGGIKRCGKTKTLMLIFCIGFNARLSTSIKTASLFRMIQSLRCSLLMDETERLRSAEREEEFRACLLNGYVKGLTATRTHKDTLIPEEFEVYSPKAIANIQGLENVLEDRCITFIMKRALNKEISNREVDIQAEEWQRLRDQLYPLLFTYWREVKETYDNLENEDGIGGREWQLWRPILALAKFFGEETYKQMKDLASEKIKEKASEDVAEVGEVILAETLLELVVNDDFYAVDTVRQKMAEKYEQEQKWLSNDWVGRALVRLGFSEKRRVGRYRQYKLTKKAVQILCQRLGLAPHAPLIPLAPDTQQALSQGELTRTEESPSKVCGASGTSGVSGNQPCEICSSFEAKMHLIPNRGVKWLCDRCLQDYEGKV